MESNDGLTWNHHGCRVLPIMTTNVGWMDHGHRVAARSPGIGYSKLNMYNFRVLQICIKDIFSWILDAFQTLAKSSLDSPRLLLKLPGPLVAHGPVISHRAAWSDGLMLLVRSVFFSL